MTYLDYDEVCFNNKFCEFKVNIVSGILWNQKCKCLILVMKYELECIKKSMSQIILTCKNSRSTSALNFSVPDDNELNLQDNET